MPTASGVWIAEDRSGTFSYCDGDEAENRLASILAKTTDRSSLSNELENSITDWVSEYHFSPVRGNLLRYLDFGGQKNILEVGCGCGALTRYLGELGLSVDAIEGSLRRADIAKLRCQYLKNVEIICSNFYDLVLPPEQYDVICFVGVMEYAGRFAPDSKSAEEAVGDFLKMIAPSLTPKGVIVIGIENRLGRKYLCGAGEDHYGLAFEGIHGYPNYSGIKTWSQDEWGEIIGNAELDHSFHYPFPDYKLPSLILNESYVSSNPHAWNHLTGISYRDYHHLIAPTDDVRFWEYAQKIGHLGSFANSFLITASPTNSALSDATPYDFVHFSNNLRDPQYRTRTQMRRNSGIVEKVALYDHLRKTNGVFRHVIGSEKWHNGILLSNLWIKRLRIDPQPETIQALSRDYFYYLESKFRDKIANHDLIDLLPMNVIVNNSGQWNAFDHEWEYLAGDIDAQFVFFRGLYYFFQLAQPTLIFAYHQKPSCTIEQALTDCFACLSIDIKPRMRSFIEREDKIQKEVMGGATSGLSTRDILGLSVGLPRMPIQLFWRELQTEFSEKRSQTKFISMGPISQNITFELPVEAITSTTLRFDPGIEKGHFIIETLDIIAIHDNRPITIQTLTPKQLSNRNFVQFNNIQSSYWNSRRSLASLNNDPHISWDLPSTNSLSNAEGLQVRIRMKWLNNEERSTISMAMLPSKIHNWFSGKSISQFLKRIF